MPRKTRATKISDKNKAWNKVKGNSNYLIESREIHKTILIVCEGQTEKCYFDAFPVLSLDIDIIDTQGETKIKLIETTIHKRDKSSKKYDEVWAVFDMDKNRGEKEFADFDNAIFKAEKNNIKVAYSNDAFELWFYLHYNYTDQENRRHFYYEFLSKQWNINYEKEGKKETFAEKIYNLLEQDEKASQEKALKWANKLFEDKKDLICSQQNPVTKVYQLVTLLNDNKRP